MPKGLDQMRAAYVKDYRDLYHKTPNTEAWSFDQLADGITTLREEAAFANTGDDTAWFDGDGSDETEVLEPEY